MTVSALALIGAIFGLSLISQNGTKPECASKVQEAGYGQEVAKRISPSLIYQAQFGTEVVDPEMVPEAGIEPATKGL